MAVSRSWSLLPFAGWKNELTEGRSSTSRDDRETAVAYWPLGGELSSSTLTMGRKDTAMPLGPATGSVSSGSGRRCCAVAVCWAARWLRWRSSCRSTCSSVVFVKLGSTVNNAAFNTSVIARAPVTQQIRITAVFRDRSGSITPSGRRGRRI